jgi:siroheme synthase
MRSDRLAQPQPSLAEIVFVGCDPLAPAALSWPARAALEAADAVLYDGEVAAATLTSLPARCFAEKVSGGETAVSRAAGLARDGWRVVRLVAADPATAASPLREAKGLAARGLEVRTLSGTAGAAPSAIASLPPLATALNGLAG